MHIYETANHYLGNTPILSLQYQWHLEPVELFSSFNLGYYGLFAALKKKLSDMQLDQWFLQWCAQIILIDSQLRVSWART